MKKFYFVLMFFVLEFGFSQGNSTLSYYVTPRDGDMNKLVNSADVAIPVCNTLRGIIKLEKGECFFEVYGITQDGEATVNYNSALPPPITPCISSSQPIYPLRINLTKPTTFGDVTPVQYLKFTAFNYGVSTIAARFRDEDNNGRKVVSSGLGASFNLGFTRGFAQITPRKITHWFLNGGLFVGLSSTELNSSNVTDSGAWGDVKRTNATFNYGPCLIIGRNNFGLMFTYGFERALGADSERWIYNDKPWFGIGLTSSIGFF